MRSEPLVVLLRHLALRTAGVLVGTTVAVLAALLFDIGYEGDVLASLAGSGGGLLVAQEMFRWKGGRMSSDRVNVDLAEFDRLRAIELRARTLIRQDDHERAHAATRSNPLLAGYMRSVVVLILGDPSIEALEPRSPR